jgi:hypothetical protein
MHAVIVGFGSKNLPSLGICCKYLSKTFTIHLGLDGSQTAYA